MAINQLLVGVSAFLLISSLFGSSNGEILFSTLPKSLEIAASFKSGQVLQAGVDNITITWGLNQSSKVDDSSYKTIKAKLCYAPISQQDRPWRRTEEHLNRDKTCQHLIVSKPYASTNNKFSWVINRDVPSATYFVRVYAFDDKEHEVAYGQSTDPKKTTSNLFQIQAITGRHVSIDIASAAFSAFSIISLGFFFYIEKKKAKKVIQQG